MPVSKHRKKPQSKKIRRDQYVAANTVKKEDKETGKMVDVHHPARTIAHGKF
jgi:hypothetical protein